MLLSKLVPAALLGAIVVMGNAFAFEPIDYPGSNPSIHLSLLGRYGGDAFSRRSVEGPPAYDPQRNRLYWIRQNEQRIDVVDIADPSRPRKDFAIDLGYAGYGAEGVAYNGKILVVTLTGPTKSSPGLVLLLDRDGHPVGPPVVINPQPTMVTFTPDGRTIVIPNRGEASDDYRDDPEGSVTLIDTCDRGACRRPSVNTLSFRSFNGQRQALIDEGVRLTGPGASVAQDLEPETVTIAPDGRTAWVTLERNNAVAIIDLDAETVTRIVPLGYKDNSRAGNGLDASDEDGSINIRPWPIRSWYEPDFITAVQLAGGTFLVTANEGDPRDFGPGGYSEVARVTDLDLDPASFPDAIVLQRPENLGRLEVSAVDGDANGDGRFEQLYAFGGRSFAIWTSDGTLVFDSGDGFESIFASALPAFFNAPDDANTFDARSDSRGAEPEPLDVGTVGARQYAFVGFERIGGVIAADITDPRSPRFEQYINYRNFAADPAPCIDAGRPLPPACLDIGDLSVEGVLFIPREQSPIDAPLLVLTHETSDSLTIYRVDQVTALPS
jgi:Choice-of-anchor I domain